MGSWVYVAAIMVFLGAGLVSLAYLLRVHARHVVSQRRRQA
jgi:hypothetical protein